MEFSHLQSLSCTEYKRSVDGDGFHFLLEKPVYIDRRLKIVPKTSLLCHHCIIFVDLCFPHRCSTV